MNTAPTRLDAYQLLHDGILALARAEQQGMRIDTEYCIRKKAHLTRKIEKIEEDFKKTKFYAHWEHVYGARTNIGSDPQLAHLLYDIKKIQPLKLTRTGRGSTDEEALRQLGIPELEHRIESGKLRKLRDTYLDAFVREAVNGYIHPFFNLHLVRTYRSSSSNPNWQNIPIRDYESMNICRRAVFPRPGHILVEVDYSGIEVRVSVCYNKDKNLIKYILDKTTDMHRDMAQEIFMMDEINKKIKEHDTLRQAAKNGFVFPQFYGDYYKDCAEVMAFTWCKLPKSRWRYGQGIPMPSLNKDACISDWLITNGIKSYDEFEEHVRLVEEKFWNERFIDYKRWKLRWYEQYCRNGYFDTLTGFRCQGVMSKNDATNYPIQGSAFHCLLWSFIQIDKIQRVELWDSRLIGQIHDSMLLDVHPKEMDHVIKTVREVACQHLLKAWDWIIVPFDVEIAASGVDRPWSEKQTIH